MPIRKSVTKNFRQSLRKRTRNLFYKNKIKTLFKEIRNLISQKRVEEAKSLLPQTYKILDKAAKVNVIKKNTVSRKKARIAKLINSKI